MSRPRPPYLQRQTTRHGATVWYVRIGKGPRVRIRAAYGTPEFMLEYQAAVTGVPTSTKPAKAGTTTLAWLVGRYRESSSWATLSNATRRQRENILKHVVGQAGDVPFAAISRAKIVDGRERRKDTPAAANQFVKTMRALFDWALDAEHVTANPTRDVKFLAIKSEGHHTWTEAEIDKFESVWAIGTRERLAFDVLLYTGLRRGDAVRLGRQHLSDGRFRIATEKTGTVVDAPILPPLRASIDASPTGDLSFIAGERGKPMTKESFGNWFREVCEDAEVPGTAHGLRKAGATRAAENGASIVELRAMFGWSSDQMPALYTKAADRARMAGTGMSKLERGGRK